MREPPQLVEARAHLSRAERGYRSEDGLFHLEEGLALLGEVAVDGEARYRAVAANLLTAYSTRICESVSKLVGSDRGLPEPELEHLFRLLLAFDVENLELPEYVRSLKIDVVKRLIERYYEGYSDKDKQEALRQLAKISAP